jgi:hypothetical protein
VTNVELARQDLLIARAASIARAVRTELLNLAETPRDLAGQCGFASMLVACALGNAQTLRTGFYMQYKRLFGKRGRYPHRHAWCRIGTMIVDATATQFDRGNKAVHLARFDEDTRYIECLSGDEAIDDIMTNWRGSELPAYEQLAKKLRLRM